MKPTRRISEDHLGIGTTDRDGELQQFRIHRKAIRFLVPLDLVDHQQIHLACLNGVLDEIENLHSVRMHERSRAMEWSHFADLLLVQGEDLSTASRCDLVEDLITDVILIATITSHDKDDLGIHSKRRRSIDGFESGFT